MRRKIPEELKKKPISFSIDPKLYELWIKYCEENEIENRSEYIEKMIREKLKIIMQ